MPQNGPTCHLLRTEKVQILKDILANWDDDGESDASELSDSAPSDSADDGSDAASVGGDEEILPEGTST